MESGVKGMYDATVVRVCEVMHEGWALEMMRCRKSLRMGAAGPGASGSTRKMVYLVLDGS